MENNVPPMPIETHLAIRAETERLRAESKRRNYLRDNKHLHDFGHDRVCKCGMEERDYDMTGYDSREVCPKWVWLP